MFLNEKYRQKEKTNRDVKKNKMANGVDRV